MKWIGLGEGGDGLGLGVGWGVCCWFSITPDALHTGSVKKSIICLKEQQETHNSYKYLMHGRHDGWWDGDRIIHTESDRLIYRLQLILLCVLTIVERMNYTTFDCRTMVTM